MSSRLVILKRPYLESIFTGAKTIEIRLAKSEPTAFGRVLAGMGHPRARERLWLAGEGGRQR